MLTIDFYLNDNKYFLKNGFVKRSNGKSYVY
jgi:hypothetical protein